MSFALEAKKEIVECKNLSEEQISSLLSGFIKYNGELLIVNKKVGLRLASISNTIIRRIYSFIKTKYNGKIEISITKSKLLKQNNIYRLFLLDDVRELLINLNIYDWENSKKIIKIEENILNDSKLFWSYIGGVFLASGSVNNPTTSNYHLELQLKDEDSTDYMIQTLNKYKFNFKKIKKRNNFLCYIKKSSEVYDFLIRINSIKSALLFEATKTEREMKNQVNRFLNIELHNSNISIKVAEDQLKIIKVIKEKGLFSELSFKAQVLADLRVENPASSFSELVELMFENGIEITKPGVSNLFRNIKKMYESIEGV